MANFPQPVLDDIQKGKAFLCELDSEDTANKELGCVNCSVINYYCLSNIINSLEMKISSDEYDDDAIKLYGKMLIIIGDYVIKVPPRVNAGEDQSVPINESAFFSAVIVPGSAPIVNIQWSIVNGSGTLTNANTANVIVDNFIVGNTVLKIVVTDANGRSASDTVILTGTAATQKVYYISKNNNTIPTEAEILAANFINVVPGSASYVVPINTGFNFHFVCEVGSELIKVRWEDTIDLDNNGVMQPGNTWYVAGSGIGILGFRAYGTSFKTEFDNPLRFIS